MKAAVCAGILAAAFAMHVEAQVMYKSTLPDGRIVYGDKPDPRAAKVEQITPDTSRGGIDGAPTQAETQRLQDLQRAREGREASGDKIRTAQKALEDAQAARTAGQEPLENERIGTAGGASRLTDDYYARLRTLDAAVENARRDLQQAQSAAK
jgi:hypothetical protein